jgi:hypothetical protein
MRIFWRLVGFEYKKILYKKSVIIVLVLAVIVTAVSVWGTLFGNSYVGGEVFESNYDAMVKDRSYARVLSGREINPELIMETAEAYSKIPKMDRYYDTPEYQEFARKYSGIYGIVRPIYNSESRRFNMEDFQSLTGEQAAGFYAIRHSRQVQALEETRMSGKAKEKVIALDEQIKTPFTFSYTDGYTRFFTLMYTVGLMAAFVMAICIAPIFSGEYASGADQLILASKHGKNMLIVAKLFTGFTIASAICLALTATNYILTILTFGSDGLNSQLQLYYPMSPYPLTMGQTAMLFSVCVFFACLMTAAITMLLSAKFKSAYGVIILISLILIVPMFINVSYDRIWLYNILHLLPSDMMEFGSVTSPIQYELSGVIVKPYILLPLFAAAVSILITPFAYRSFKTHQIV